jgi:hypothetical protein
LRLVWTAGNTEVVPKGQADTGSHGFGRRFRSRVRWLRSSESDACSFGTLRRPGLPPRRSLSVRTGRRDSRSRPADPFHCPFARSACEPADHHHIGRRQLPLRSRSVRTPVVVLRNGPLSAHCRAEGAHSTRIHARFGPRSVGSAVQCAPGGALCESRHLDRRNGAERAIGESRTDRAVRHTPPRSQPERSIRALSISSGERR